MQPDRLVYMANQIGKFFQYQKEDEIVPGIANHIKKFWDPRMRDAIFAYIDQGGEGLDPKVLEALLSLRSTLQGRSSKQMSNPGSQLT
jgi:formate dehydrogenase subunit delta